MGCERVIGGRADLLTPSQWFTVWMSSPPTHSLLFLLISCHRFPFGGEFFPSLSPLSFTLRLSICKQMHTYVSVITSAHGQTSHHHIKALIRNMCPGQRLLRSPKIIQCAEKLMNNKKWKSLNSVSSILPADGWREKKKKSQPHITSISPLKEWADFAELLEITCWIKSPYYLKTESLWQRQCIMEDWQKLSVCLTALATLHNLLLLYCFSKIAFSPWAFSLNLPTSFLMDGKSKRDKHTFQQHH